MLGSRPSTGNKHMIASVLARLVFPRSALPSPGKLTKTQEPHFNHFAFDGCLGSCRISSSHRVMAGSSCDWDDDAIMHKPSPGLAQKAASTLQVAFAIPNTLTFLADLQIGLALDPRGLICPTGGSWASQQAGHTSTKLCRSKVVLAALQTKREKPETAKTNAKVHSTIRRPHDRREDFSIGGDHSAGTP